MSDLREALDEALAENRALRSANTKLVLARRDRIEDAIAALPAPAGEEVTAEHLCKVIEGVSWNGDVPIQITKQILKSFTILAKPAQEGQGS